MPKGGLKTAKASKTVRPTSGKVLLALFNILNASGHMDGVRFLDLFSGTGEVALAALDNGAASVLAIESERDRAASISQRFAKRYDRSVACCFCADVRRAVPKLAKQSEADGNENAFDVIFADPPYHMGWGECLPLLIEANLSLLKPDGAFVFERSSREIPAEIAIPRDDRTYGETVLSFYWNGGRHS